MVQSLHRKSTFWRSDAFGSAETVLAALVLHQAVAEAEPALDADSRRVASTAGSHDVMRASGLRPGALLDRSVPLLAAHAPQGVPGNRPVLPTPARIGQQTIELRGQSASSDGDLRWAHNGQARPPAALLLTAYRLDLEARDIKSVSILYATDSDMMKMTNFGIVRLTDSSQTRMGMETPSFRSPEQMTGRKEGNRSSIHLLGAVRFRRESIAVSIYKIADKDGPDTRTERLARAVTFSFPRNPENPHQNGMQMAAVLRSDLPSGTSQ
jgi:hypothetical protein